LDVLTVTKKFKRAFINPAYLKSQGIVSSIKYVIIGGGQLTVVFNEEPTVGDIQRIKAILNQERWIEVDEE